LIRARCAQPTAVADVILGDRDALSPLLVERGELGDGQSGPGGGGGGASIALISVSSPVMLIDSELISTTAGKGGNGAAGQQGQQMFGGGGIGLVSATEAAREATAASEATAGSGGSGDGGMSVGVLYRGGAPTRQNTNLTLGTAGAKGRGGNPGANDGIAGIAQEELELP
jgi:hypothetical protein